MDFIREKSGSKGSGETRRILCGKLSRYPMNKRRSAGFILLALLIVAAWLFWPSDESRIRRTLREETKAFEAGNLDGVMTGVSYTYRDAYGMPYIAMKGYLKRFFEQFSDIGVECGDPGIRLLGEEEAVAELNVRVLATMGNERGYILGDLKGPVRVRVFLRKEHAAWLIAQTGSPELARLPQGPR